MQKVQFYYSKNNKKIRKIFTIDKNPYLYRSDFRYLNSSKKKMAHFPVRKFYRYDKGKKTLFLVDWKFGIWVEIFGKTNFQFCLFSLSSKYQFIYQFKGRVGSGKYFFFEIFLKVKYRVVLD